MMWYGLEKSWKANERMCSDVSGQDVVEWRQRQNVEDEVTRFDVVQRQLGRIIHHQTSFQVARTKLHADVQHVDDVTHDVNRLNNQSYLH